MLRRVPDGSFSHESTGGRAGWGKKQAEIAMLREEIRIKGVRQERRKTQIVSHIFQQKNCRTITPVFLHYSSWFANLKFMTCESVPIVSLICYMLRLVPDPSLPLSSLFIYCFSVTFNMSQFGMKIK